MSFHCWRVTYDAQSNVIESGWDGPVYQTPSAKSEEIETFVGRNKFNPCSHVKYLYYPEWGVSTKTIYYTPGYYGPAVRSVYTDNLSMVWCRQNYVPPSLPLPQLGINQFVLRAVQHTRPKFKAELSLPNFLFELKDLKRIIPTRDRIRTLKDALTGIMGNPFKRKSQRTAANELSQEVASQYLNANFGYLPLIDDCFKIVSSIEKFNQQLQAFIRDSKTFKIGHYTETIERSEGEEIEDHLNSFSRGYHVDSISEVKYTCTIKYQYEILVPKLYVPSVFIKYMGFRSNPRILWDALPFSFVLDWVLRFGKALESFDEGAIPVRMVISECCVSRKYSSVTKHYYDDVPNPACSFNMGERWLQATEGYQRFDRWLIDRGSISLSGLPPLPVTDKISVKEFTLALALGKTLSHKKV